MLLSGLKAEAEGHAIGTAGSAIARNAVAAYPAETRGRAGIRRSLPPVGCRAIPILDLAVARLIVIVLRALSALGIADAAENLDLTQQEQLVRRGVDGAALVARRGQLIYLPDAVLHLCRHQGKDGWQVRASHGAARPAAAVGVGAVHILGLAVAVVQLEG